MTWCKPGRHTCARNGRGRTRNASTGYSAAAKAVLAQASGRCKAPDRCPSTHPTEVPAASLFTLPLCAPAWLWFPRGCSRAAGSFLVSHGDGRGRWLKHVYMQGMEA